MITSRDINSTVEAEIKHMFIDVVGRYRNAYNQDNTISEYEFEIPYPEEFQRSPNTKYVRLIYSAIRLDITEAESANTNSASDATNQESEEPTTEQDNTTPASDETNQESQTIIPEPFWDSDNQKFIIKNYPYLWQADDLARDDSVVEPYHLAIGSSFVQDTLNDEKLYGLCNPRGSYIRTYEQHTTERSFKIWIVDLLYRVKMNLKNLAKQNASVFIELELVS